MSATIRVLAQAYPSAGTETTLYTNSTNSFVSSSLVICNQSTTTPDNISVRICIGGASDSNAQILFNNSPVPIESTICLTAGITGANTDVIKVKSVNGTSSFNLFGQEN
jgi:hypothetical protein